MKDSIIKYMLLLCVAGAMLSFYLYYSEIINVPVICPNDGCAKVAQSQYSFLLGVPISLWGFAYYIGFASLFILRDFISIVKNNLKLLSGLYLGAGVAFTIYLRYVEFAYIHAICVWCWGSVLIMLLLVIFYFVSINQNVKKQID